MRHPARLVGRGRGLARGEEATDMVDHLQGHRVRATLITGERVEGPLTAVVHLDDGDRLFIAGREVRLAKVGRLELEDGSVVWPPPDADGLPIEMPRPAPYDAGLLARAERLVRRRVTVVINGRELSGFLEAVSPPTEASLPQLFLTVEEGAPTVQVALGAVDAVEEEYTGDTLTAEELEAEILRPEATPADVAREIAETGVGLPDAIEEARQRGLTEVEAQAVQAEVARLRRKQRVDTGGVFGPISSEQARPVQ